MQRLKSLILSDLPVDAEFDSTEKARFERFIQALAKSGIDAEHRFVGYETELLRILERCAIDLFFCAALRTAPGPEGRRNIHEILEEQGMPYVGSTAGTLELAISKAALKERWLRAGVATPSYFLIAPESDGSPRGTGRFPASAEARLEAATGYPYIVKPAAEGNSRGIDESSVVRSLPALRDKVEEVLARFGSVLVERFLGDSRDIREFTVAMIGSGELMIPMPAEIVFEVPKSVRLVSNEDKENHRAMALPIAEPLLRDRVARFALRAFGVAGVRDYSRCDILLADDALHAIEINGQPMLPDPWFEACAAGAGMDGDQYLNAVFLACLARIAREGRAGLPIPPGMREMLPTAIYNGLCG